MLDIRERIKQEYRWRLRTGEQSRGLLTKLAKEYELSSSTVRSWKNRDSDDWDDISDVSQKNVATNQIKSVATGESEGQYNYKYNWSRIKIEYISSECNSIKEFAILKGIPYSTISKVAADGKWNDAKEEHWQDIGKQILEEHVTETVKTLREIFEENQAIERALIAKLYEKIDQLIEEIDLKQIIIQRKKRAKVEAEIPAKLRLGDIEVISPGDFEFIQEETETDIDIVKGIADHQKLEAAVRGLEKLQQINRIAFGVDRLERKEDRLEEIELRNDLKISHVRQKRGGADTIERGEIIVRFVDSDNG